MKYLCNGEISRRSSWARTLSSRTTRPPPYWSSPCRAQRRRARRPSGSLDLRSQQYHALETPPTSEPTISALSISVDEQHVFCALDLRRRNQPRRPWPVDWLPDVALAALTRGQPYANERAFIRALSPSGDEQHVFYALDLDPPPKSPSATETLGEREGIQEAREGRNGERLVVVVRGERACNSKRHATQQEHKSIWSGPRWKSVGTTRKVISVQRWSNGSQPSARFDTEHPSTF
jgi:hypothetical protein